MSDNKGKFVKGMTPWNKGKPSRVSNPLKGKKMSEEWKAKLRKPKSTPSVKGEKHHNWKGGAVIKHKRNWLQQTYRMTLEQHKEIFDTQNGRCGICGKYEPENATAYEILCIDHNHTTGKVRGLLCRQCNTGIGQLRDSIELLENAINYLNKYD